MRVAEPTRLVPPLLRRGSQQAARAAIGRALARAGCDVTTLAHRRVPAHLSFAFEGFDRAYGAEDRDCGAAAKEVLDGAAPDSVVQQVAYAARAAMLMGDAGALLRRVADEFETQGRVRWEQLAAARSDAETHARARAHVVALHCVAELLRRAARWEEEEAARPFNNDEDTKQKTLISEADLDAHLRTWLGACGGAEGGAEEAAEGGVIPRAFTTTMIIEPRPPSRRALPRLQAAAAPSSASPTATATAQAAPAAPRSVRGTPKVLLRPLLAPPPSGQGGARRWRS